MENADEHLEGDPLKYSDIFERTMKYLERVSDWTPASVLYGKLLTAGYSPTAIKATLERLKHISNVGSTRQNGETAYHWYQRKEPFDTINQKAIDEWVD